MVGQRRDEAHAPLAAFQGEHAGRAALALVGIAQRHQADVLLHGGADVAGGPEILGAPQGIAAHGHEFDEAHVHGQGHGRMDEVGQLAVIDAAQAHGVDLDPDARGQHGVQGPQHFGQHVAPGHTGKGLAVEAVQRQVHGADADTLQQGDVLLQQRAVGGDADVQVVEALPQPQEEVVTALARKGFPAGQTHLSHAHAAHDLHQTDHLLIAQHLFVRDALVPGIAVTIQTAQVAAVRQ